MSAGVSLVVAVYLLRDVLFSLCVFEVLPLQPPFK